MADRSEIFCTKQEVFRDGQFIETMQNVMGPTLVAMATKFGLFCTKSPISRLVWQIDWRCLHLPGFYGDGRFNRAMQNVAGPTLVAMATTFGLGVEIQSPTGLSTFIITHIIITHKQHIKYI